MEELIYRVIESKLKALTPKEQAEILKVNQEYTDRYIQQFTLYKLNNIKLEDPEIDDHILFLIYWIKKLEHENKKELDRIYDDLIYRYERGALTALDLKDVIYNRR